MTKRDKIELLRRMIERINEWQLDRFKALWVCYLCPMSGTIADEMMKPELYGWFKTAVFNLFGTERKNFVIWEHRNYVNNHRDAPFDYTFIVYNDSDCRLIALGLMLAMLETGDLK